MNAKVTYFGECQSNLLHNKSTFENPFSFNRYLLKKTQFISDILGFSFAKKLLRIIIEQLRFLTTAQRYHGQFSSHRWVLNWKMVRVCLFAFSSLQLQESLFHLKIELIKDVPIKSLVSMKKHQEKDELWPSCNVSLSKKYSDFKGGAVHVVLKYFGFFVFFA